MEGVAHAVAFGAEVALIVGIGGYFDGDVLYDFESVGLESDALDGIIGYQTHFVDAQMAEHLCATAVVALVGFEAEM